MEDDARFCENCGNVQAEEAAAPAQKKSKTPLAVLLIVAILVTIAGVVVGVLCLFGGGSGKTDPSAEDETASLTEPQITEPVETTTEATEATTTTQPPVVVVGDATGVVVFPTGEPHAAYAYRVKAGGGLFMRSGPAQSYSQIQLIPDGATVTVYYSDGEWWYGAYNNLLGWMNSAYVRLIFDDAEMPTYEGDYSAYSYPQYYYVAANNGVQMYTGPDTTYDIVCTVPSSATFEATRYCGDWIYGCWENNTDTPYGWVYREQLNWLPLAE